MPLAFLAPVHCIVIDGAGTRRFAQAQFSGDVRTLQSGHWQWNAWLDARGRVSALMHLVDTGDGRLLAILKGGDAARVRDRLARYLLRMQATLTVHTLGGYAGRASPLGTAVIDGQNIVLGYGDRSLRLVPEGADAAPDLAASNAWRLQEIRAGWPTLPTDEPSFLPPALGLERLGAVSFDKGCYPGQEIAARLHFRGGHKLRLHHVRGPAPLDPGPVPHPGGKESMHVLDCALCRSSAEALIIARQTAACEINVLGTTYDVVSKFDA